MANVTKLEKKTVRAKDKNAVIPAGKDLIEQWKKQIKDFPDIKPQQAQCIELMMDYVMIQRPIRITVIAKAVGVDHTTIYNWMKSDAKYVKALELINTRLGNSALSLMVGRISTHAMLNQNIKPWAFDALGKYTGRIQTAAVPVAVQVNLISKIDKETGEIVYIESPPDKKGGVG